MIRNNIFFLLLLSFVGLDAQVINQEHFESLSIRNIGPAGMSGRVTAIDVDLSNPENIFVGSAAGGVWKSPNGGISWEPIFDDQPTLSIGALKISQKNPAIIWAGTGEGNPRNSANCGAGIYKSIDGGMSWELMGLEKTKVIHRIVIHPDNPEIVYVAAMGSPWGAHPERGVFKTTDGGKSWKKILYINDLTGAADMVLDPSNPNKLVVAMWEHIRTPWDFKSGGKGSGMHITYDGGEKWEKITDKEGLPSGELGRIGIAFAPSNPKKIYALVESVVNGLYQSEDGGKKWSLVSDENIGNRPFYYSEIYVDPQNENRIYNLWSYLTLSEDGGKSFRSIADYGNNVHPDHHAFWIHPEDSNFVIDGNDGGLNISRDSGETWHFITNLPLGQFYHINIDNEWPYNIYGGMQDNGSWVGPSFVLRRGGMRNHDWQELYFGDGFDVSPHPKNVRYGYAMSQGGNLAYYDKLTGKSRFVRPNHEEGNPLRFNWNAALAQDPHSDCGVYYASQYVHYSEDCGYSWKTISPDLSTNDTTKQQQDKSGGLTIDATNAENYTTILCVAPSIWDKENIYAGTDDGQLQVTYNGGGQWQNKSAQLPGLPKGAWIPHIEVSQANDQDVFVVANDYRRNNFSSYAYHSKDAGRSWRRIVDDRQVPYFTTCLIQDPEEPNLLFLGTDGGLFISFDKGQKWTHWTEGFPAVQIRDLKIQSTFDDLVIGTFGRSIWVLDDLPVLRELARGNNFTKKEFCLLSSPTAYLSSSQSYRGVRFTGQGDFRADSKSIGGRIHYWLAPNKDKKEQTKKAAKKKNKEKKAKSKKENNDLIVKVLNTAGDTIRSYTAKPKEGFNKINWGLRQDGVSFPSHNKRKEKPNTKPRGYRVLPGTYKLIVQHKKNIDSVMVSVKEDPRVEQTDGDRVEIQKAFEQFYTLADSARIAHERLIDAESSLGIISEMMEFAPDSTQTEIKAKTKDIRKLIAKHKSLFMLKAKVKGYQSSQDKLNRYLWDASRYVRSSWKKPGPNAQLAIAKAKLKTEEVLPKVAQFFDEDWKEYQDFIASKKLSPFAKD